MITDSQYKTLGKCRSVYTEVCVWLEGNGLDLSFTVIKNAVVLIE